MRHFLLFFLSFCFVTAAYAQPGNDDCENYTTIPIVDFGTNTLIPYCSNPGEFDNIAATQQGTVLPPAGCGSGGWSGGDNDVWFYTFSPGAVMSLKLTIAGDFNGGGTMVQPQVAVYSFDCANVGVACSQFGTPDVTLIDCAQADVGDNYVELVLEDLGSNTCLFIRVNDYSLTGASNEGTFQMCIDEYVAPHLISDGGSFDCAGEITDTGGEDANYGDSEYFVYTINPSTANNCISFVVDNWSLEQGADYLRIYDGPDVTSPFIGEITGVGTDYEVQASSGQMTLEFSSNGVNNFEGFFASWQCTTDTCTIPPFSSCEFATIIPTALPFVNSFSTCGAGSNYNSSDACGDTYMNGEDYVFEYFSPGAECISISVNGTGTNTGVFFLDGCPDDPTTSCLSSTTEFAGNPQGSANIENPGVYYIVVSTTGTPACTPFTIDVDYGPCPPTNDNCDNPTFLADLDGVFASFTAGGGYTPDLQNGQNFCGSIENNAWFTFIADSTSATVTTWVTGTCPNNNGFQVAFYDMPSCDNSTLLNGQVVSLASGNILNPTTACAGQITPNDTVAITADGLTPGNTYVFMIDGFAGDPCSEIIFNPGDGVFLVEQLISPDSVICADVPIQLFTSLSDTSDLMGIAYSWTPAAFLDDPTSPNPIATVDTTTTFTCNITTLNNIDFDASVTITVVDTVIATIDQADTIICQGASVVMTGAGGGNFTWSPAEGLNVTNEATVVATPDSTTTYQMITDASCGTDTAYITVTVIPALAEILEDTIAVCLGDTAQLNVTVEGSGGAGLFWFPFPPLNCFTCTDPVATVTETTTFFAIMNTASCTVTDSIVIKVDSLPDANLLIDGDTTICAGDSLYSSLTAITPEGAYPDLNYVWYGSSADGYYPDSLQANVVLIPLDTIDFVRIGTNNACSDTVGFTVNVVPPVEFEITADSSVICAGDTSFLLAASSNFPAGPFEWDPDPSIISTDLTQPNIVVNPTQTTTYYVLIGDEPCQAYEPITVVVSPEPQYGFTTNTDICAGDNITIGTIATPGMTYTWTSNPVDPTLTSSNSGTPSAAPTQTTTYYVFVESGACSALDSVTINVTAIPTVTATVDPLFICIGNTVQLDATGTGIGSYSWTTNNGNLSDPNIQNPVGTPTASGMATYTVTVEAGGNSACTATDQISVTIENNPVYAVNEDESVCEGTTVQLGSTNNANTNYVWTSVPNDPTISNINAGNATATPSQTTTYTLTASSLGGGCVETDQIVVTVTPFPTVTPVADPTTVCPGQDVNLSATSPDGGNYSWSTDNGSLSALNGPNTVGTPNNEGTANYNVTVQATANASCTTTETVTVIVEAPAVAATIDDALICPNSSIQLGTVDDANTNYSWTASPADASLTGANTGTATASPGVNTVYTLVASSASGACNDTYEVEVTMVDTAFTVTTEDTLICEGTSVQLNANGAGNFTWDPSGTLSCDACPDPMATPDSTITYTATNECGQMNSVTVAVGAPFQVVTMPSDTTVPQGNTITLGSGLVNNSDFGNEIGLVTYQWVPESVVLPTDANPTVRPTEDIVYTVTITSEAGCVGSATVDIVVTLPNYGIPNAFTPDGDENNDYFNVLSSSDNVVVRAFQVYDRWGQLVYDNDTPTTGWDGKFKDVDLPQDAYVYVVEIELPDGQRVLLKGDVTLLR